MRDGISGVVGVRYVDVEGKNLITNKAIKHADLIQEWLLYVDENKIISMVTQCLKSFHLQNLNG